MSTIEQFFTTVVGEVASSDRYIVFRKPIVPPGEQGNVLLEWHGMMRVMRNVQQVVNEGTYRLVRVETIEDRPTIMHVRFVFQRQS